ncbi:MAG: histidinol-phosphatase HisJ family protein [Clostridia bacterium]|nr:histidinol-phosphatase HisJ family protein [Clostridia bacterium]
MFLIDYHLHTYRSDDARHSLMQICQYAVRKGIKEIAVTDHFEPTAENVNYSGYNPKACIRDIEKARRAYKGWLNIKFGIELGHPHLYPESSERIINQYPYDFVLASGHKMKGDVDFSEINYQFVDLNKYCNIYLDNLKALAEWGQYDCVGHFDLVKRYAARQGVKIDLYKDYKDKVTEILKIIIKKNKGIEINTSGLRQYSKDCLPDYDIVKLYHELGGNIITVGSDAHTAPDVGEGVVDGYKVLLNAGFSHVTIFDQRIARNIIIEDPEEYLEKNNNCRIIDLAVNM